MDQKKQTEKYFGKKAKIIVLCLLISSSLGSKGRAEQSTYIDTIVVTASRIKNIIPGASVSVIDSSFIRQVPAQTVPEILEQSSGLQVRDLFGGTAGSLATVDLRGIGATATENTLILVNGRRLNGIDSAAVDWASIPKENIERIEILRGHAGAVLYGGGAVGGAINIVTKTPVETIRASKVDVAIGSHEFYDTNFLYTKSVEKYAIRAHGNYTDSAGYRENNELRQRNIKLEMRRTDDLVNYYLRLGSDDQILELPGVAQIFPGSRNIPAGRRTATTPNDFAIENGLHLNTGAMLDVSPDVQIIFDIGVRSKDQESVQKDPNNPASDQLVDTEITTWSLTPRTVIRKDLGDFETITTSGLDIFYYEYDSDRKNNANTSAIHRYRGSQSTVAVYAQSTLSISPKTRASAGIRYNKSDFRISDSFDSTASGASIFDSQQPTFKGDSKNLILNAGLEQDINKKSTFFARTGQAFRAPTVDERVRPFSGASFDLKTQTSQDFELGARYQDGRLKINSSVYWMDLENEIHFNANTFANENFDDTRRYGFEGETNYLLNENISISTSLTYARAKFTAGTFKNNDVPLVSRFSGSATATWKLSPELSLTGLAQWNGKKRYENDEANFQPLLPRSTLYSMKLSGKISNFFWSATVNNILDRELHNYGVASASTFGRINIYPLPERTIIMRAGVKF